MSASNPLKFTLTFPCDRDDEDAKCSFHWDADSDEPLTVEVTNYFTMAVGLDEVDLLIRTLEYARDNYDT